MLKLVADYTGCLHCRHPFEMGGVAFSVSLVWAQIFPFVALLFYNNDEMKGSITVFLVCSFCFWLMLNIIFFCTIDLSYSAYLLRDDDGASIHLHALQNCRQG